MMRILKGMHFYKAMVTFTEVDDGARIDRIMRFDTEEEMAPIRSSINRPNEENLDNREETSNGLPRSAPMTVNNGSSRL